MNISDELKYFNNSFLDSKIDNCNELKTNNVENQFEDNQTLYENNIFNKSSRYIEELKNVVIPLDKRKKFEGKTLLCAWLTKLCPAKCECCFFRSDMNHNYNIEEEYQYSKEGVEKLIQFINDSNNSYIMLSGGGDPMVHIEGVNEIVSRAKSDRIVIVTSGFWANTYENAKKHIDDIYNNYRKRDTKTTIVFRISVDNFHCKQLGKEILPNVLKVFSEHYATEKNFLLQVHTIINDNTVEETISKVDGFQYIDGNKDCISDNNEIAKIVPKRAVIRDNNGYEILVGKAKMFYASLRADLREYNSDIEQALKVFDEDMIDSEYGNPAVVTNYDGTYGLDFWIDYNGNTTTWGNQQLNDLYNIYTESYKEIFDGINNNIMSYSFLDKGYYYRESIVREVNPRAVLKSKIINLRDFASALLLEEDDVKLYYGIRLIQDYLNEGILELKDLALLPEELIKTILLPKTMLQKLYNTSDYDIIVQYLPLFDKWTKEQMEDLFLLIKLGHFNIKQNHLNEALKMYNLIFKQNVLCLEEIYDSNDSIQYARLHNRIAYMKESARNHCLNNEKNKIKMLK